MFSKTEMSEVLTEILKVDPSFDKDSFLKQCERDIIPNILEVCWTVSVFESADQVRTNVRQCIFLYNIDLDFVTPVRVRDTL